MLSESEDESEEAVSQQAPASSNSTQQTAQQIENSPRLLRITNKDVLILPHDFTGEQQLSDVSSTVDIESLRSHYGLVLYTKITGMIPRPKGRPSEKDDCVFLISDQSSLFLKHICLIEQSQNIVGLISEQSFNTLERIYWDLPYGTPPNQQQSIRFSRQFITGIHFLHKRNLIHGKLQPYFIHFDSVNNIKIFLAPEPYFQTNRNISYTADELRNGDITRPTLQCDIYSVGAILYRFYHASDPPKDKREAAFRPDMSRTVTTLIRDCWGNPQDRPNVDFCVRKLVHDVASEEAISRQKKLIETTTAAAQLESKKEFASLRVYEEEELKLKDKINQKADVPSNNISLLLGRLRTFPYSGNELPIISHRNVISHIGITRIQQKDFLLLEACSLSEESAETMSLDQYLDNQDIDVDKLYNFALDIARGLSYLHLKKIAYRDLSLKRVLINGSQVKLEHPVVVRPEEIYKEAIDLEIFQDIALFGKLVLESLERLGANTKKKKNPEKEKILKHIGESIISSHSTTSSQLTVFEQMSDVVSYLEGQPPSECLKRITMDPVPDINDLRNHSRQRKEIRKLEQIRLPPLPNPLPFYTLSQINCTFVTDIYEEYVVVISDVFNGQVYIKKQRGRAFLNYQCKNYQDMEIEPVGSEEEKQIAADNLIVMQAERQNEREMQLCIIQHPRILQPYAFIRERSDLDLIDGIVLEYAEPLQNYIERLGPISEEVLWRWAYQLANVMTYLHEKFSIMHRSIIPESLFVDTDGNLKLGDFSFSRIYDESKMFFTNTLQKNRAFMAPETFGQPLVSYSFPSDVWSYAMVLYFLTHRRLPYTTEEVSTSAPFKQRLVEQGHRPPLSDFPNFHYLIQSCWATEPTERPTFKQIQDYFA